MKKKQPCPDCNGAGYTLHFRFMTPSRSSAMFSGKPGKLPRGVAPVRKKRCTMCKGKRKISNQLSFELRLKR